MFFNYNFNFHFPVDLLLWYYTLLRIMAKHLNIKTHQAAVWLASVFISRQMNIIMRNPRNINNQNEPTQPDQDRPKHRDAANYLETSTTLMQRQASQASQEDYEVKSPCLIYYWSPECQNSILEIVVWKSIARNVMRDAWELLDDDDFNERPRARPWPCSPHIQHQSLAMRPTLGRDPGKLPGFDIINFWEENCFPLREFFCSFNFVEQFYQLGLLRNSIQLAPHELNTTWRNITKEAC